MQQQKINSIRALLIGAALCVCHSAWAVDGAREINAACVVFGCFDGDSTGFPITISDSGKYVLTSNLTGPFDIVSAIEVTTDNVSIDLNGFSIIGPITCSGTTISCSGSGNGDGIDAQFMESIMIQNGIITGAGDNGIEVGNGSHIEDVIVAENADNGILAGSQGGTVLRRIAARENGGHGVFMGLASHYLMDSVMRSNGDNGVFGGFCGNVLMSDNDGGNSCVAIAPNQCPTATDCD